MADIEQIVQEIAVEWYDADMPYSSMLNAMREISAKVRRETLRDCLEVVCRYNSPDGKTATELRRMAEEK